MVDTSAPLKNENVKIYHITFDEAGVVNFALKGSQCKKDNGIGGQKGGLFFWTNYNGVNFWLNRLISSEKEAVESGIFVAKKVPPQVYVLEFEVPKKMLSVSDWQIDAALSGKLLIPLISKYYYKLYKKKLMTDNEASLYLNCPLVHDKKYSKKITGLMISQSNMGLKSDNNVMSFKTLTNYSNCYSGIIQRLHDFLYLKSKRYVKEYNQLLKNLLKQNSVCSIKYCGKNNLKPVAFEMWDSKTSVVILKSTDVNSFIQKVKRKEQNKIPFCEIEKRERE